MNARDFFTSSDGQSYCLMRTLLFVGVLAFLGESIYSLIHAADHVFDAEKFGNGLGWLLTGGGAGTWAKEKAEQNS